MKIIKRWRDSTKDMQGEFEYLLSSDDDINVVSLRGWTAALLVEKIMGLATKIDEEIYTIVSGKQ